MTQDLMLKGTEFVEADSHHPQINRCLSYFNHVFFERIPERYRLKCWIAGGALRTFFMKDGYSDIDIFFRNEEVHEAVKQHLMDKDESELVHDWKNSCRINFDNKQYDLTKHYFLNPVKTLQTFDFTVSCCAVTPERVYHYKDYFIDLTTKKLILNPESDIPYPLSTLQRMQKYIKKGFTICNGGMLELSKNIAEIDFDNEDQNVFEHPPSGGTRIPSID